MVEEGEGTRGAWGTRDQILGLTYCRTCVLSLNYISHDKKFRVFLKHSSQNYYHYYVTTNEINKMTIKMECDENIMEKQSRKIPDKMVWFRINGLKTVKFFGFMPDFKERCK